MKECEYKQFCTHKCGRPPKRDYNLEALMQELIKTVEKIYQSTNEIKATALKLSFPPNKVKRLLITGKAISYLENEKSGIGTLSIFQ